MNVDRLSVTVPSDLGRALRALAKARRSTVSTVVADAIEREIRGAALDLALLAADQKFGAVPDELVAAAEAELSQRSRPRRRTSRRSLPP